MQAKNWNTGGVTLGIDHLVSRLDTASSGSISQIVHMTD